MSNNNEASKVEQLRNDIRVLAFLSEPNSRIGLHTVVPGIFSGRALYVSLRRLFEVGFVVYANNNLGYKAGPCTPFNSRELSLLELIAKFPTFVTNCKTKIEILRRSVEIGLLHVVVSCKNAPSTPYERVLSLTTYTYTFNPDFDWQYLTAVVDSSPIEIDEDFQKAFDTEPAIEVPVTVQDTNESKVHDPLLTLKTGIVDNVENWVKIRLEHAFMFGKLSGLRGEDRSNCPYETDWSSDPLVNEILKDLRREWRKGWSWSEEFVKTNTPDAVKYQLEVVKTQFFKHTYGHL